MQGPLIDEHALYTRWVILSKHVEAMPVRSRRRALKRWHCPALCQVLAAPTLALWLGAFAPPALAQTEAEVPEPGRVVSPRPRRITPEEARESAPSVEDMDPKPRQAPVPDTPPSNTTGEADTQPPASSTRAAPETQPETQPEPDTPPAQRPDSAAPEGSARPERPAQTPGGDELVGDDTEDPPQRYRILYERLLDGFYGVDRRLQWLLGALLAAPLAIWALIGLGRDRSARPAPDSVWMDVPASGDKAPHPLDGVRTLPDEPTYDPDPVKTDVPIAAPPATTRNPPSSPAAGHSQRSSTHFARWLMSFDPVDRREAATEALVYWMAYADERYPAELRRDLLSRSGPLNRHDTIKREVLLQNTAVFADSVRILLDDTDRDTREQILDYLAALLVSPHNVTPVQNTLLRFLADAFELGQTHLEHRFASDFGHPLPPLPRPDQLQWWHQQDPQQISNWRLVQLQTADAQTIGRLRLGVDEHTDAKALELAWQRARSRCNPLRYPKLSDWERILLNAQIEKLAADHALLSMAQN